jgi:glucan 1,3-beta-glucosidase
MRLRLHTDLHPCSFATEAPAAGAIVVQWNIAGSAPGAAGMWDSHIRLGGAAGTKTDILSCPTTSFKFPECAVAFLALHLTTSSSAYLEGTWVWTSDHDMEDLDQQQTNVLSARGILSESQGPVWMIGTGSEHHSIYQYSLVGAKNHYMGLIQTETVCCVITLLHFLTDIPWQPYYQPVPASPAPFSLSTTWKDPMTDVSSAWGLWVRQSSNIFIFGAGLYSVSDSHVFRSYDIMANFLFP